MKQIFLIVLLLALVGGVAYAMVLTRESNKNVQKTEKKTEKKETRKSGCGALFN